MKELISILLACRKALAAAWDRVHCKSQQYWTDWLKCILRLLITLILTESGILHTTLWQPKLIFKWKTDQHLPRGESALSPKDQGKSSQELTNSTVRKHWSTAFHAPLPKEKVKVLLWPLPFILSHCSTLTELCGSANMTFYFSVSSPAIAPGKHLVKERRHNSIAALACGWIFSAACLGRCSAA